MDSPVAPPARSGPWSGVRSPSVILAALGAGLIAAVQLREGILQILDTGSYLSGAQAVRDGHPFTSTLAPSFSNFSVIEVLERGGRLPFVDFPVGYATVGGALSFLTGVRGALSILVVVATAVLAAAIVIGPTVPRHAATPWLRAGFAVAVTGIPVYRLVVQGALSEPLFCAVLVGFVAGLVRYRADGRNFALVCVLGASLGLLRFLGGGLAILPAIERYRRTRQWKPSLLTAIACLAPVALNVIIAGAAGGGHTSAWHGIDGRDLKLVSRSLAGMLDATTGDLGRTFFQAGDVVPWWGYPVAVVWVAGVGLALVQFLGLLRTPRLPAPLELALVAAGGLTAALLAGIAGFDALATPDNRIMLPAGVLSLCGLVWCVDIAGRRLVAGATAVLALWTASAVRPWNVGDLFTQPGRLDAARVFEDIDARVVITNDADGFHILTGIPTAYLPPQRMSLTDEPVDQAALYEALPCALFEHDGVVIAFAAAMFGSGQAELDGLAAQGRLDAEYGEVGTVYRPTGLGC